MFSFSSVAFSISKYFPARYTGRIKGTNSPGPFLDPSGVGVQVYIDEAGHRSGWRSVREEGYITEGVQSLSQLTGFLLPREVNCDKAEL